MRINTIEDIYTNKNIIPMYLVNKNSNEIQEIEIIRDEEFKTPFKKDEFGYVLTDHTIGMYKTNLLKTALFTTKDEAAAFAQNTIDQTVVEENPAGYTVGIYIGSPSTNLTALDPKYFKWTEDNMSKKISLCDIYEQAVKQKIIKPHELLTVFYIQPLKGYIYVCGNYNAGDWVLNGETKGYA